jgi:hypothetical protein
VADSSPQPDTSTDRTVSQGDGRGRSIRTIAIGLVVVLGIVAWGGWQLARSDDRRQTTPPGAEDYTDTGIPVVENPRSYPGFAEAYALICEQTLAGVERIHMATEPDLLATIGAEHLALMQRIEAVYRREDLWAATEPLVLEYAETIADDLSFVLDGSEVDMAYLDGDANTFRSLCQDWFAPI